MTLKTLKVAWYRKIVTQFYSIFFFNFDAALFYALAEIWILKSAQNLDEKPWKMAKIR